jgi:hypothetical protein
MAIEYRLTEVRDLLNRSDALRGAPFKFGEIRLSIQPNAIGRLFGESGDVGRGTRRAALVTVERAKASVNAYGRVATGFMRDSIHATFVGSNQYASRFSVQSEAPYSIYQHDGTRWIKPAPFLRNALDKLRPQDFTGA